MIRANAGSERVLIFTFLETCYIERTNSNGTVRGMYRNRDFT
jgi:hypothetical protein